MLTNYIPGNGARYNLYFSKFSASDDDHETSSRYMLVWLRNGDRGGPAFMGTNDPLHYSYLMEKMGVNVNDAIPLLRFIKSQGFDVIGPEGTQM